MVKSSISSFLGILFLISIQASLNMGWEDHISNMLDQDVFLKLSKSNLSVSDLYSNFNKELDEFVKIRDTVEKICFSNEHCYKTLKLENYCCDFFCCDMISFISRNELV